MSSRQILHSVGSGGGSGGGDGSVVVGREEGGFVVVVRAGQRVDGGVGLSHLQNLVLCINEHEVRVL